MKDNSEIKERVAVVCPGPGASLIRGREHTYHRIVAVNRAVLATKLVSSWVCLDAHTFAWVFGHDLDLDHNQSPDFAGEPRRSGFRVNLVCSLAVYRQACSAHTKLGNFPCVEHTALSLGETAAGAEAEKIPWKKFGSTVALAVAAAGPLARLPVEQIDCYGVAWDGENDFDGFSHDRQRRDADRWAEDKRVWTATVRLLNGRGIRVRRIVRKFAEAGATA